MFENLTQRLETVFRKLRGRGVLSEADVTEASRDVRRALLEADVHFRVARDFIARVRERAVGQDVLRSIGPGQQFVKIVHDELVALLGGEAAELRLDGAPPAVVMLVGLQGSGKTTLAAKLARHLTEHGRRPLLVAGDRQRPAAVRQLEVLGGEVDVPVHVGEGDDPVAVCRSGMATARKESLDAVLLDTAGRLHVDEALMAELAAIEATTGPRETLFVADGMTGQDAVKAAGAFAGRLALTGIVLTKMDGDARGGAALSIRAVTNLPIKFVGVGETVEALERFHPDRVASRILGMGDVVSFVERAQAAVDTEKAAELAEKLARAEFTLEDFRDQLRQVREMGPMEELLAMLPGGGRSLGAANMDDGALVHAEAMINSMTPNERFNPHIIDGSRRRRIARGSGTSVQEVNRLLKQFFMTRKLMKRASRGSMKQVARALGL